MTKTKFHKGISVLFNVSLLLLSLIFGIFLIEVVDAACPPGMKGYWKLDENPQTHLGTVADDSGNGNAGTFYTNEGATNKAVAGKVGGALSFDGVNDYINLGYDQSLNPTTEITVSSWIKSNQAFGATTKFDFVNKAGWWSTRNDERNAPHLGAPGIIFHAYFSDRNWHGVGYKNPSPPLSVKTWYHVVGVFDTESRGLELWVNGELIDSDTSVAGLTIKMGPGYAVEYPVIIGASSLGPTNFFNGFIDEVAIYDRALTAEEIKDCGVFYIDIGLRVYNGSQTVAIAAEPQGTLTSPLRISKNGVIYGIVLVAPGDPKDSGVRIRTSSGIKALRKI